MFRFALRPLTVLVLVSFTSVQAQSSTVNLPIRAVVSYANLLTPGVIAELEPGYNETDDLAFGIVDRHVADNTVCPATAAPIKLALTNGVLPYDAFVFYLADMLNGAACAPQSLAVAEAQLGTAGVNHPLADAGGNITEETLTEALTEPTDDSVLADSGNDYDDALTPTSDR